MKKKKAISILLIFILIFSSINFNKSYGQEIEDNVIYLVGSMENNQIFISSEGIEESRPIASMSKLMTYYIVMDSIKNGEYSLDTETTVTEEVFPYTAPGNSRMDLIVGENISIKDLLDGLMVVSANDAAVCLAINDSKTEEAFVEKMNKKAKDLGLEDSYFVNSHGLDTEDGSSNSMSPIDLYKLALNVCKDYPQVLEYSNIDVLVQDNRNFVGQATSAEFQNIPGFSGLKTGYTDAAGKCFAGVFNLEQYDSSKDFSIVTIVMNCRSDEERYRATEELVKTTSQNFHRKDLVSKDESVDVIKDSSMEIEEIDLFPLESMSLILSENSKVDFDISHELAKDKYIKGEDYGNLIIVVDGEEISKIDLTVKKDIEKANIFTRIGRMFSNFFSYMFLMLFG